MDMLLRSSPCFDIYMIPGYILPTYAAYIDRFTLWLFHFPAPFLLLASSWSRNQLTSGAVTASSSVTGHGPSHFRTIRTPCASMIWFASSITESHLSKLSSATQSLHLIQNLCSCVSIPATSSFFNGLSKVNHLIKWYSFIRPDRRQLVPAQVPVKCFRVL